MPPRRGRFQGIRSDNHRGHIVRKRPSRASWCFGSHRCSGASVAPRPSKRTFLSSTQRSCRSAKRMRVPARLHTPLGASLRRHRIGFVSLARHPVTRFKGHGKTSAATRRAPNPRCAAQSGEDFARTTRRLTCAFSRLAQLDSGVFERLNRCRSASMAPGGADPFHPTPD